jgi:hypothetical protein
MREPLVPRALLAAATPTAEYESVLGDLYEEYVERSHQDGRVCADLWYWSQALRSIPALLTYSRNDASPRQRLMTAAIVLGLLVGMLLVKDSFDRRIDAIRPQGGVPIALYFGVDWLIAAICGAFLAAIVRYHPVRLALLSSALLAAAFAAPILIGVSPRLVLPAWILIVGAIPAMCIGAAAVQSIRNTRKD